MISFMNRRAFLAGGTVFAASPFLPPFVSAARAERKQAVVRVDVDIANLDPGNRIGTVDGNVILSVCQTLARFDAGKLTWSNDAAKEIKQISETEYTFELNPGQMFSDGYGEMTAEDVKFSFDRFITGDAKGKKLAYAEDLGALDKAEITGKYTGRLLLKHPSPALWLIGLCDASGAILSKKATEALGDKIATQIIGSGPYRLAEWRPKEQFVLEINPDYKGAAKAHFPRILAKFIAEPKTALLSFQGKELDFTAVDPSSAGEARKVEQAKVIEIEGIDYTWISLNVEKGALADPRVRQAIRLGIDIDMIIAGAYGGAVSRAKTLLAPGLIGAWPEAPLYNRDLEKAKALLAEAGQTGLSVSFTCLNEAVPMATAQIVQANLAEIGVTVTINAMDSGAYWAMGSDDKSKDLELTLIQYLSKFDPSFQTQWFLSAQVGLWNWQRWKSADFDRLHAEGLATADTAKRDQIYIDMQKLLDESASCVWITHGRNFFIHADWLKPCLLPNAMNWQYEYFGEA